MKPLREAQREVLGQVDPLPIVTVDASAALGLALAAPVTAPHDVPPFANSGMDGFAVRSADVSQVPVELVVLESVAAGNMPTRAIEPGTAIKIMTGAPLPEGADAVVPVEDAEEGEGTVKLLASRPSGANVRAAGGDMRAGQLVFPAGVRITPAAVGVLAALGVRPEVRRRPVAAVLSTGDELVPPDAARLAPGEIRDSNRPMLAAVLAGVGCEVIDLGIVPDDADALRATLQRAAGEADMVVSSGGVSMGEYDLVKDLLDELGSVAFWKVAVKPGKPFAFGHLGGTPFFGLPGNPVSVFVSFEQFVRPAILAMMGSERLFRPRIRGTATGDLAGDPARVTFARVSIEVREDGRLTATPLPGQGSNMLAALSLADGLAVVSPGQGVFAGDDVELEMFRWPERLGRAEVM